MLKMPKLDSERVHIHVVPAQDGYELLKFSDFEPLMPLTLDAMDMERIPIIAWRIVTTRRGLEGAEHSDPEDLVSYAVPVTLDFDELEFGEICIKSPLGDYNFPNDRRCNSLEDAKEAALEMLKRTRELHPLKVMKEERGEQ